MENTQNQKRFVTNIDFFKAQGPITSTNSDFITVNVHEGWNGDHLYPMKIWTDNPQQAITKFAFAELKDDTWFAPQGFLLIDMPIQNGNNWSYLCIERGGEGPKVTDVSFINFYEKEFLFKKIDDWNVFPQFFLNTEMKTVYTYLLYKTELE